MLVSLYSNLMSYHANNKSLSYVKHYMSATSIGSLYTENFYLILDSFCYLFPYFKFVFQRINVFS